MQTPKSLILKSASPRRAQMLKDLGLIFEIHPAKITEHLIPDESYSDYLKRITLAKIEIADEPDDCAYISSDTIVVLANKIYFKPTDKMDAINIIMDLSGKTHEVYSGLGLYINGDVFYEFDRTFVTFKNWNEAQAQNYIDKFRPFDKAGSYGIQDFEGPVADFKGSYSNVLGFPLQKFFKYIPIIETFNP
ncbi:MAG: Maf family protein [Leptospira sp.]|nr:Maf family protein [Leptospira sp.]